MIRRGKLALSSLLLAVACAPAPPPQTAASVEPQGPPPPPPAEEATEDQVADCEFLGTVVYEGPRSTDHILGGIMDTDKYMAIALAMKVADRGGTHYLFESYDRAISGPVIRGRAYRCPEEPVAQPDPPKPE